MWAPAAGERLSAAPRQASSDAHALEQDKSWLLLEALLQPAPHPELTRAGAAPGSAPPQTQQRQGFPGMVSSAGP